MPACTFHRLEEGQVPTVSVDTAVPRPVRIAGAIVAVQGLAGLAFAVVLLVDAIGGRGPTANLFGEAGYFAVIFGGVLASGIGLVLGKRWARGPTTVIQILLIGVAWYATGPSGRPLLGLPLGALCVLTLVLLFGAAARAWADGDQDESDATGR